MDVLKNQYDNYILPFFWQHGEDDAVLLEEMDKIYRSGIRAVCIESRPHEDFCKEGWWEDFDLIMSEAEKRGMKVWLLDDKHFPTGYANGLIKEKYPHLRKWHIREEHVDVVGPLKEAKFIVRNDFCNGSQNEESLVCIIACRRDVGKGEELLLECIDLTGNVKGDFVYWDIPEGYYRIFLLFKTRHGAGRQEDYIHMIDPASVDVLIEAVYEPHYQRYKKYFGNTFAGFFSDEPCFGNTMTSEFGGVTGFYESSTLGTRGMHLPWRDDLVALLSEHTGEDAKLLLPALWFNMGLKTSLIRTAYMDIVTNLYKECFSMKLGDWCRAHGVEYIGHIIEDMNAHARLGCSAGHYFRSLSGQDMAGIDVVLHQIVPGFNELIHAAPIAGGKADPAFFDYILAKLAASLSHIQPQMKGRAMCEMFGAYGWAEGMSMMKWLTDHMLVRGINHFVPHAFSPKYPDPDCPPYFYARGENPQYRDFKVLMDYTNKMSHLFTDGRHMATAAILYHAEAEWSGGKYMLTEVPAKVLYDEQIDFDIVPMDTLLGDARVEDGKLVINMERFDCLIIPYSQILPFHLIKILSEFSDKGLCVIYSDGLPEKSSENLSILQYTGNCKLKVLPVEELAAYLIQCGYFDIRLKNRNRLLRFYHYERAGTHFYMFFNESLTEINETVIFPFTGKYNYIDLLQDITLTKETKGNSIELSLTPYQSCVIVFSDSLDEVPPTEEKKMLEEIVLDEPYDISITTMPTYPDFKLYKANSSLINITGANELPEFSGIIRYTTRFTIEGSGNYMLDLGSVGETARVRVNGNMAGTRICQPYLLDITNVVRSGDNILEVEVANTLAYNLRDNFSCFMALPPSGLLGPVRLVCYN